MYKIACDKISIPGWFEAFWFSTLSYYNTEKSNQHWQMTVNMEDIWNFARSICLIAFMFSCGYSCVLGICQFSWNCSHGTTKGTSGLKIISTRYATPTFARRLLFLPEGNYIKCIPSLKINWIGVESIQLWQNIPDTLCFQRTTSGIKRIGALINMDCHVLQRNVITNI